MSVFSLRGRSPLAKVFLVLFWWPLVLPLWLVWFILVGWWWLLFRERYPVVNNTIVVRVENPPR